MSEEKPTWRADYRWVITRDIYWESQIKSGETDLVSKPEVGRSGPWNVDATKPLKKCFRLYIEDGNEVEAIYEGWASETCEMEPLDDFGMPNFGCTVIKWFNSQTLEWEHV